MDNKELIEVEDQILELDDGNRYVLMDEFDFEGKRYFFTVGFLEEGYDFNKILFFEHGVEGDEEFVEEVKNNKLVKKLLAYELSSSVADEPELSKALMKELDIEEDSI